MATIWTGNRRLTSLGEHAEARVTTLQIFSPFHYQTFKHWAFNLPVKKYTLKKTFASFENCSTQPLLTPLSAGFVLLHKWKKNMLHSSNKRSGNAICYKSFSFFLNNDVKLSVTLQLTWTFYSLNNSVFFFSWLLYPVLSHGEGANI